VRTARTIEAIMPENIPRALKTRLQLLLAFPQFRVLLTAQHLKLLDHLAHRRDIRV
jgi:hypothetical protein